MTQQSIELFRKYMDERADEYHKKGLQPDYYVILRNSLIRMYFWDILSSAF